MFHSHQPAKTLTLTVLACYLLVFMEWLFFVSKPSFLINLTAFEHLFLPLTSAAARIYPDVPGTGLNASHMSAYGCARETTPFIDSLFPQSLLVQNHFANNAKSTGSIGAFFSGVLLNGHLSGSRTSSRP